MRTPTRPMRQSWPRSTTFDYSPAGEAPPPAIPSLHLGHEAACGRFAEIGEEMLGLQDARSCHDRASSCRTALARTACLSKPVVPRIRFAWARSATLRNNCWLQRLDCSCATSVSSSRATRRKHATRSTDARADLTRLGRASRLHLSCVGLLLGQRHAAQGPRVAPSSFKAHLLERFGQGCGAMARGRGLSHSSCVASVPGRTGVVGREAGKPGSRMDAGFPCKAH